MPDVPTTRCRREPDRPRPLSQPRTLAEWLVRLERRRQQRSPGAPWWGGQDRLERYERESAARALRLERAARGQQTRGRGAGRPRANGARAVDAVHFSGGAGDDPPAQRAPGDPRGRVGAGR